MHHVCHDVDNMGNTRVRFKCAKAVELCAARGLHVGQRNPIPVSGRVRPRLEKLRHSSSVRLTCMGRRCSEMVQGDGDPDDRCQHLGEGETTDYIPTRRRWQKSSSKVTY